MSSAADGGETRTWTTVSSASNRLARSAAWSIATRDASAKSIAQQSFFQSTMRASTGIVRPATERPHDKAGRSERRYPRWRAAQRAHGS